MLRSVVLHTGILLLCADLLTIPCATPLQYKPPDKTSQYLTNPPIVVAVLHAAEHRTPHGLNHGLQVEIVECTADIVDIVVVVVIAEGEGEVQ